MCPYESFSVEKLNGMKSELLKEYNSFKAKGLKLDMSRGKPSCEQLNLSLDIFKAVNDKTDFCSKSGFDYRNYGLPDGIDECRKLFAEIIDVDPKNVLVGGNSSVNMIFDLISQAMTHGLGGEAWGKQGDVKFLCPVPGYDRHFSICEYFGIKMINVPMQSDGPDMDMIENLIKDSSVKGIFCVPKYSNPTGITFSDEVVRRMASMKPAAKDFRIIWDNAYCVHDFNDTPDTLLNIYKEAEKSGNEDIVFMFASTSKISFPGSGVAAVAASENNLNMLRKRISNQTIGPDKLNQLRHVKFYKDLNGIKAHMKKHAALIAPKFKTVLDAFENELSGVADWKAPNGGYFISLNVMNGCAKKVGRLCADAGVKLTPPGATYPYGIDPFDSNIRIAPTYPPIDELKTAVDLLCISVKLATIESVLEKR